MLFRSDEYCETDPEDVWRRYHDDGGEEYPLEIQEWTIADSRQSLPDAETLCEELSETASDNGDGPNPEDHHDGYPANVLAAAETFLQLLADDVFWNWCNAWVATWTVTVTEPVEDGDDPEPIFVRLPRETT